MNPDSVRRALTIIANDALPIVIIDEFDRLDTAAKRAIADTIKSLSDHAVQATALLVGVADSVDQLIDQHHSVERALVQVHMPRMSSEEIRQIILTGLNRLELKIDSRALIKIDTLARGLPHYAHLLGLHAAEEARDQELDTITMSIVDDGIHSAIAGSQQTIKNSWHQATTSPRKDNLFADVLLACVLARPDELGFFAPQDIRDALRVILDRPIEIANFAQHESKKGTVLERRGEKRNFRFRFINPLLQTFVVMQGFALGKVDP